MRISIALVCLLLLACSTTRPAPDASPAPSAPAASHVSPLEPPDPPPPSALDTRTPIQIAQAACAGGKCKGSQVKPLVAAASGSNPIIPASWTVPAWSIDPANSILCASDQNSGTAATCTGGCTGAVCASGIGPVVTYQEINTHRWGCQGNPIACPRLQQNTVLTFLSSQAVSVDPVVLTPEVDLGSYVAVVGALGAAQTVCAGTLSAVTNITVASNLLTQATLPCTAAANELVVDATNLSNFWTYKVNGAAPAYFMSQPLQPYTVGGSPLGLSEVALANGDAVTIYQPVRVNLVVFAPVGTSATSTAISAVVNTTLQPGASNRDAIWIGGAKATTVISNTLAQRSITVDRPLSTSVFTVNTDAYAGVAFNQLPAAVVSTGQQFLTSVGILGGIFGLQTASQSVQVYSAALLDSDVIFTAGAVVSTYVVDATIGAIFIDAGNTLWVGGKTLIQTNDSPGVVRIWGTGTYDAIGVTTYPSGAGQAAATFKSGITLLENAATVGCVGNPANALGVTVCNSPVTAANLDTVLGATVTTGCLFNPGGGGAFCTGQDL